MRLKKLNKRGGSFDALFFVISFFALIIAAITIHIVWDDVQESDIFDATAEGQKIKANIDTSYNSLDTAMVMVYVFGHLGIIGLAFLLRVHPAFAVVSIVLSLLLVIIAAPLSNALDEVIDNEMYDDVRSDWGKVLYIWNNIVFLEIIWFAITAIVTYGITRWSSEY